jgi:hypothetical protein
MVRDRWCRQAGQEGAQQSGEGVPLLRRQRREQRLLLHKQIVDRTFDQCMALAGEGHEAEPDAARANGPADQARPRGITVNVVSPGFTAGTEFLRGRLTGEREQRLIAETRNGRAGTPADIAATVAFLASPGAGHLTGQVIHVNGGAYLGR